MTTSEQRVLLNDATPLNDTPSTTAPSPVQLFTARHRPGYARVPSVSVQDIAVARNTTDVDEILSAPLNDGAGRSHGLGITSTTPPSKLSGMETPPGRDSGSYSRTRERATSAGTPLMSAPSTSALSGSTFNQSFGSDTSYQGVKNLARESRTSLQSGAQSMYAKSDAGLLSVRSRYDDFQPHNNCQTTRGVKRSRFTNWVSITIFLLAIFSTIMSAVFLMVALTGPKFGRNIRSKGGKLTPSSAAFLTSFFAKLIELSFVTVVVAFVGQALARRAFIKEKKEGVTLAELSMRNWLMQPGTMLTQWESVRYAGLTVLGVVSFIAAVMAILYTSAATALVQPQLKFPGWEKRQLSALVKSQYANPLYIGPNCKSPIAENNDKDYRDTTCLQMEHASMAFHNYYSYLSAWGDIAMIYGNGSIIPEMRPKGYALLNDNTTITAPWIEMKNISIVMGPNGTPYYVNNVTMAMPHTGIVTAATDPFNDIMQPSDVEGARYNIKGSLPSPIVNVLCVTMTGQDLEPFVYNQWNLTGGQTCDTVTWKDWPGCVSYPNGTDSYLNQENSTLANIFRWGDTWGPNRYPPVFQKLPQNFNTLLNETKGMMTTWGPTNLYLLVKGDDQDLQGNPMTAHNGSNFAMCQMSSGLTGSCMSVYNASSSGGRLEAVCETNDTLQYNKRVADAQSGNYTLNKDWPNIASEWARSLSLSAGTNDANASNARLLSQFIVTSSNLSAQTPSTAEAIAVLAGSTLIQAITDAPLVFDKPSLWNHTLARIQNGERQWFTASMRVQQYASGGSQDYQKPFYIVLVAVVIINVAVLLYFIVHRDWYTDFSQPEVLFALAVNSPPSEKLAGSCGCGPEGKQYRVSWKLKEDAGHYYMESQDSAEDRVDVSSPRLSRQRFAQSFEMMSPTLRNRFGMGKS